MKQTKRMLKDYFKQGGKITKCPDAQGIPLSSCTAVPKSVRHNGVSL